MQLLSQLNERLGAFNEHIQSLNQPIEQNQQEEEDDQGADALDLTKKMDVEPLSYVCKFKCAEKCQEEKYWAGHCRSCPSPFICFNFLRSSIHPEGCIVGHS